MEKFWKVAVTICGLGAIGAFVFYMLYKNILTLPIFSKLSQDQTFIVMLCFIFLIFVALLAILAAYILSIWKGRKKTSDEVKNGELQDEETQDGSDIFDNARDIMKKISE